jgi:flagellar biosynthetic protein FlhB
MAEQDTGQERTEQPTPKRLEDARKKGQVLRSRELNTLLSMIGVSLAVMVLGAGIGSELVEVTRKLMTLDRAPLYDRQLAFLQLQLAAQDAIRVQVPLFLAMLAVSFAGPIAIGGVRFSPESIQLKLENLDVLKGVKRMFGPNALLEVVKALLKVFWLGAVAAVVVVSLREEVLSLSKISPGEAIYQSMGILSFALLVLSLALIPIAAIDVPHQVWQHFSKLRMTRQEVKDELKETDGNPELKGRMRQQQREISQRRMMDEVPHADVVITNPTHFAVALRYDPRGNGAPLVVAKGADVLAGRIRHLAGSNAVPVFEAAPLARALYWSTEVGDSIPAGLYVAVARVLAYVYQLRAAAHPYHAPPRPTDIPVPDEFRRD